MTRLASSSALRARALASVFMLGLCSIATTAAAQATDLEMEPAGGSTWRVGIDPRTFSEADQKDGAGSVSVTRMALRGEYAAPAAATSSWAFNGRYEASRYEGDGGGSADASDVAVSGTYSSELEAGHGWFASLGAAAGEIEDGSLGDGLYQKAAGGFTYSLSDDLRVGVGAFVIRRIEEDPIVIPFPLVEWRINDRSSIGFARTTDPSLGYTFRWRDGLVAYSTLNVDITQYSVDDNSALVDHEYSLRGGVVWQTPLRGLRADAFVGVAQRTLEVDTNGEKLDDTDIETAPGLGVALSYGF